MSFALKLYSQYITNYDVARATLSEAESASGHSAKFASWRAALEASDAHHARAHGGLPLDALLIMPVQVRLARGRVAASPRLLSPSRPRAAHTTLSTARPLAAHPALRAAAAGAAQDQGQGGRDRLHGRARARALQGQGGRDGQQRGDPRSRSEGGALQAAGALRAARAARRPAHAAAPHRARGRPAQGPRPRLARAPVRVGAALGPAAVRARGVVDDRGRVPRPRNPRG